jgi:hypothetical protein
VFFKIVGSAFLLFSIYRLIRVIWLRQFPKREGWLSYQWVDRESSPGEYGFFVFVSGMMVVVAGLVLAIWIRTGAGT